MLTVLAIEESLMRDIGNFEPLLQSVADMGSFKLCSWKRDEDTLEKAIPALFDREYISEGELVNYNILIVSDDRNCYAVNPFDGEYNAADENNLPYDLKLNELAKMLGIVPAHSTISYEMPVEERKTIKWNISVDKSLTEKKLAQYKIENFTRPQRIYLVAVQKEFDVDINEFVTDGVIEPEQHAQFRTAGRYPANCRFFKFNLTTNSNRIKMDDYFRLAMAVLSLAYNDGADELFFAPDTLYSLDCDINNKSIVTQITSIYSRVHYVKKFAQNEITRIRKTREYYKNKYYDMPYLDSNVEVKFETNEDGLYLDKKRFGLAKNCPTPDEPEFDRQRESMEKNIKQYLKAPVRALRTAVRKTKRDGVFVPPTDELLHLTREQTEDLDESIDELEISLIKSEDINVDYPKWNEKFRKDSDIHTKKVMKKRSTVSAIIIGSVIAFAAFLVAFVPYIYNVYVQTNADGTSVSDSLLVTFGAILAMAITGMITLVVLRIPLSDSFRYLKRLIDMLVSFIQNQARAYSKYLSALSSFMKRNSFKRYLASDNNSFMKAEEDRFILNRNRCDDIENLCAEWADGFNFKLRYDETKTTTDFILDDAPKSNSIYTFVVSGGEKKIKYNRTPSHLVMPYEFVSSLNITREEVYE